jgi:glutamate-1-semialdehyde 2,1-aminomutase
MATIAQSRIKTLVEREASRYFADRPKSRALFERAKKSLLAGVPMSAMSLWVGSFPIFVTAGNGAYLTDVDGHRYLDLCLGDTGAMMGHTPKATIEAASKQMQEGMTYWLPTEDSIWVAEELTRRFGLQYWQVLLSASDANQVAISVARDVTQRYPILVFDGCYHGHVPESRLGFMNGEVWPRARSPEDTIEVRGGVVWRGKHADGPLPNQATGTRVIQFNDLDALEAALSTREIACVLCEPAMTNVGIILPDPGYHTALRELTRRYGTLLIIDETHTICGGHTGLTRPWHLEPDIFTLGKPIAGGIPAAVMGVSDRVAKELIGTTKGRELKLGGRTLAGSAFQLAAMRATLEHVLTESNYKRMIPLGQRLAEGVDKIIKANDLPWHVIYLGCRAEYRWTRTPPRNGKEARAAFNAGLHELVHLFFLNRGILLTPPHSMVLISPDTTAEDVDFHNRVFGEFVDELLK